MLERAFTDDITYTFETDEQVIGIWEYVDFITDQEIYTTNKMPWDGEAYVTSIEFLSNGVINIAFQNNAMIRSHIQWTKNSLVDSVDITRSLYRIETLDGQDYLFLEWKTGDYIYDGISPYYYIFRRVISE